MNGVWIKKVVTTEQLEALLKAEYIELYLETIDGKIGEKLIFYSEDAIYKKIEEYKKK